jgi:hypothetical protein
MIAPGNDLEIGPSGGRLTCPIDARCWDYSRTIQN